VALYTRLRGRDQVWQWFSEKWCAGSNFVRTYHL